MSIKKKQIISLYNYIYERRILLIRIDFVFASSVNLVSGSLMLSVWGPGHEHLGLHPAPTRSGDLVLAQLHDYQGAAELVGVYEVTEGKMQVRQQVPLSCPGVEAPRPFKAWVGRWAGGDPAPRGALLRGEGERGLQV